MWAVLLSFLLLSLQAVQSGPLFKVFTQGTPIYKGRADPIISPGVYSGHVHRVFGASRFSLGITGQSNESAHDTLAASQCTTSSITVDKSAYWIPDLYYKWPNGSFSNVPNGGLTVYYFGRGGSGNQQYPTYVAFPRGFRMIAGNPFRRSYNGTIPEQGISYACLGSSGSETNGFPTASRKCTSGLRAQVFFPQCWNGRDLDSADHTSHVAYPSAYNTGNCPSTHPVRIPAVFYEVLYGVDQDKFPHGDGVQPFVWAQGDPTGYGLHGDFQNGWDVNILQQAMTHSSCDASNTNNGNIPQNCLPLQPYVKTSNPDRSCKLEYPILNYEDIGLRHWISHLPGNNPVFPGPQSAPIGWTGVWPQTIDSTYYRVLLKSVSNNLYVTTAGSDTNALKAATSQSQLSYTEVFIFVPLAGGKYGFAPELTDRWVSSNDGSSNGITPDRYSPSGWEQWTISFSGGTKPTQAGTLGTLISSGSKYVTVASNGNLVASSTSVSTKEQFWFIDANAGISDTRPSNQRG